ncbi:hypothetical protein ACQY0O_008110 [Thecaphora frezii]
MASTWHTQPRSTWNGWQRFIVRLGILPVPSDRVPLKLGQPIPVYSVWAQHCWVFPRAVLPLAIHYAYMRLTGWTLHPVAAFVFYVLSLKYFAITTVQRLNDLALQYGYFDGQVPRDGVPDTQTRKVALSLIGTISIRPLFAIFFAYDRRILPSISIYFPLQLFLYACILDYYFYIYHRSMHEIPLLWRFHEKHHRAKHPNPLLSAFADSEQEWGDILVIPLLTWLTMPVDFSTWWLCTAYILYTEAMGHSGIRLHWETPATAPILRHLEAALSLHDHDLHHSRGWRRSGNYGKQTLLYDAIFGTKMKRTECTDDMIDWNSGPACW